MIMPNYDEMIGDSPVMRSLRSLIARVAPLDLPVLIQGPTGAGKELVARALHAQSGRPGRFVPINVCAIPDTMFESALFGHVRGAFTGATADAPGYLAEADRGTLMLDEISGLPLALQAKLLRAIETGEFRPIGGRADRCSRFRTVAATNEPLDDLVTASRFRSDLAHRLSGIVIHVPPLRDRLEDIPALVHHFIRRCTCGRGDARLTSGAIRMLQDYDWPGNVRELRHVVERAVAFSGKSVVERGDVEAALRPAGALHSSVRSIQPGDPFDTPARRRLLSVLEECGWDTARAASRLGIHRATIYRRMSRLGIITPRAAAAHHGVRGGVPATNAANGNVRG